MKTRGRLPGVITSWQIRKERGLAWPQLEAVQQQCIRAVTADPSLAYLLLSEPQPTFTGGLSANANDVLWDKGELERRKVALERVSRGGQWTFHGPGQVLLYIIARLDQLGLGSKAVHRFLEIFRSATQEYLRELGLDTLAGDKPFGLYCEQKKMVSYGIGIQRGIVFHGLALYQRDQRDYFCGINPCGVEGGQVTSLHEQGITLDWDQIAQGLANQVKKGFK